MEDLDTHPSGLDVDTPEDASGGSNKLVLLALLVGVVGVILGVTGIYMATQAAGTLETYKAEVAAAADPTAEALEKLDATMAAKFDDIEGRMGNMGGLIQQLRKQSGGDVNRQLQDLRDQTQTAFDSVSREVQANRAQLNETNTRLEQLVARGGVRSTAASGGAASTSTPTAAPAEPLVAPEGGSVHTVASGENPSVIARKYGITLRQLMAANPTLEPTRMQVGDQIIIPAP